MRSILAVAAVLALALSVASPTMAQEPSWTADVKAFGDAGKKSAVEAPAPLNSSWIVEKKTSPVTGKHEITVRTLSRSLPGPFGARKVQFQLVARCKTDYVNKQQYRFEMYVWLGGHMTAQLACMNYKVDDRPPGEECGSRADNYGGYFFQYPAKFARVLAGRRKLIMEIPTYRSGTMVAEFDVSGLEGEMRHFRPHCDASR